MIKKYYVKVNEKGEEIERKLSTHNDIDNFMEFSKDEMLDMYYQASAELSSKARKVDLIEGYLNNAFKDDLLTKDQDELLKQAHNNIIDAFGLLWEKDNG